MSFTRFHDDPARIKYGLEISTYSGRYALDTPGPGVNLPYLEDSQIRMQKWGANLMTNPINIESDLRGLTRQLNRDNIELNDYVNTAVETSQKIHEKMKPFVDESRASHPAWMYRDLEQTRWEVPFINPLVNVEKKFHDNIQTRILEKDYYVSIIPQQLNGTPTNQFR
jgi:hypothetical protein